MTTGKKKHARKAMPPKAPRKSKKKKVKVGKNRQSTFEAEGGDTELLKMGTKSEYGYSKMIAYIVSVVFIVGAVMIFCGIHDSMVIKLGEYEYSGSMVGLVMVLCGCAVLFFARPKVKLKK